MYVTNEEDNTFRLRVQCPLSYFANAYSCLSHLSQCTLCTSQKKTQTDTSLGNNLQTCDTFSFRPIMLTSQILSFFTIAICSLICQQTQALVTTPPIMGIGAVLFRPKGMTVKPSLGDDSSLVEAGKFFTVAFWCVFIYLKNNSINDFFLYTVLKIILNKTTIMILKNFTEYMI